MATSSPRPLEDLAPHPLVHRHRGVAVTGSDGEDGPKAFYIHIEAMLRDILACVEEEPETGPWYGVRYSDTTFGIFRGLERVNTILAYPAHVYRADVLLRKQAFTWWARS